MSDANDPVVCMKARPIQLRGKWRVVCHFEGDHWVEAVPAFLALVRRGTDPPEWEICFCRPHGTLEAPADGERLIGPGDNLTPYERALVLGRVDSPSLASVPDPSV